MIEWKPEDFEEGAAIFLEHWVRCYVDSQTPAMESGV